MKDVGSSAECCSRTYRFRVHLCNQKILLFSSTLIFNDMKQIYKKVFKSKKPSLASIHAPGPVPSTSTLITSTTDLVPFNPACNPDAIVSAQVTAGVSVSVQLRPSHP